MARCHVSTRKGLFTLERGAAGWDIARANFVGDNVTLAMHDPRSGDLIAALNHGHFGVKLHRSRDGGATWNEIAAPKYPEKPEGYTPKMPVEGVPVVDWSLKLVWALEPGGADQPGVIWCGTLPGGLFKSDGWRRVVVAQSRALGRSAARTVVWRRRRSAGHSFDLR